MTKHYTSDIVRPDEVLLKLYEEHKHDEYWMLYGFGLNEHMRLKELLGFFPVKAK